MVAIKEIPLIEIEIMDVKAETEKEIKFMSIFNNNQYSVKLHDKYEQNKTIYIVMDLCDGDLSEYVNNSKNGLSIYEIKVIFKQLNSILYEMRKKDMIHNDLKIENLLIKFRNDSKEFELKLTDYGLAKLISTTKNLSDNEWGLTPFTNDDAEIVYTVEKADLLVLGVDIYRMLFKGIAQSIEEYLNNIDRNVKDEDLKDLMKKMIVLDAHQRIDWDDYFKHPFFKIEKIDFEKIENIVKN